jgi:5-methylcytosine-specific restriction endonuclease McrA
VPATHTSARRRAQREAAGTPWHGGNWIRREKRLRIYERDGFRCVWCLRRVATLQDVAKEKHLALATLDHLVPRERGGSNEAPNLVTACATCNQDRGTRSAVAYAFDRYGHAAPIVLDRVIEAIAKPLPAKRAAAA